MKTKFEKIDLNKLPKAVRKELEEIKTGTENFTDADLIEVYQDNFNELYSLIEKKHPEAIKSEGKKPSKKASKFPGKEKVITQKGKASFGKKKKAAKKVVTKSDPEKESAIEDTKEYPNFPTDAIKRLYDLEISAEQEEEAPQYIIDIRKNALEKELKKRDPEWLKSRKEVYNVESGKKQKPVKSKKPASAKKKSKTTKTPVEPPKPTTPEEDIAACKQVISEYNKARRSENPPVKHQDRTIIKNRVESVFKTVYKGYKSKGNKDYKNRLKIAQEAQELFSDLIINFDSALQSGSISDAEKIIKGIKSLF